MSIYNGMSGKESNLEQSYILLDLAGQVALRVRPPVWSFVSKLTAFSLRLDFVRCSYRVCALPCLIAVSFRYRSFTMGISRKGGI
jgi:hypothetical protein